MAYSITNLKTDLAGAFHGTTVNQIQNLYALINRAAHQLIADCDPMETKRIQQVSGNVFNGVWDYQVPADLKANKVIDLYPQVNRYPWDVWMQAYNQDFDRTKGLPWSNDMFSILFNTSIKTIRINAPFLIAPVLVDAANDPTNWVASGGATTPTADAVNFVANGASLLFNLQAGQTTGSLSKTLPTPIDLSSHLNLATEFLSTFLPVPSNVTNVQYQFGSDASDYYQVNTNVTQQNTAFQTGWNLLAMPWLGATVVGTPNPASISYIKVTWTYNGTLQTGVRLNDINSNLGSILMMEYYSKDLFRSNTGVFQENVLEDSDLFNLDTDAYQLIFNLVAHYASQQLQGISALFYDGTFFMNEYQKNLSLYLNKYPSEIQLPQASYYNVRKPRRLPTWRQGF